MKTEVQELVKDYLEESALPYFTEEILRNKKNIGTDKWDTKDGREMLAMARNFSDWYNPLGKKMREYIKSKGIEEDTDEELNAYSLLHDEVDKLLGFKLPNF